MGRLAGHLSLSTDGVAKTWSVAVPKTDDDDDDDARNVHTYKLNRTKA